MYYNVLKKFFLVLIAISFLGIKGWTLFFSPPTTQELIKGADLIIRGEIVKIYSEDIYDKIAMGKQKLLVRVKEIYENDGVKVKAGDKIKVTIFVMDARLPVFKKPLNKRDVMGKDYLMFLYKNGKYDYRFVYGPYGLVKLNKHIRMRFHFWRNKKEKVTKPKVSNFLDKIIIENPEFLPNKK